MTLEDFAEMLETDVGWPVPVQVLLAWEQCRARPPRQIIEAVRATVEPGQISTATPIDAAFLHAADPVFFEPTQGEYLRLPDGAVAYHRQSATWLFDKAEANRLAKIDPRAVEFVPECQVELWEDGSGQLSIHCPGDEIVFTNVEAGASTFFRDVAALFTVKGVTPTWFRQESWTEHLDRVARSDGPRIVAYWDGAQVNVVKDGEEGTLAHWKGPGPVARRYMRLARRFGLRAV